MRFFALTAAMAALAFAAPHALAQEGPKSALDFKLKSIDGKDVDLSAYKGKVVLLVNVASYCGNTKQYKTLQKLYEQYRDDGLVVIGVPANEFGKQEPGTNEEIKAFCESKYSVTFPMMAKVVVKGKGQDPLYGFLTSKSTNPEFGGDIRWNFDKFLIGRDGQVLARFAPGADPMSADIVNQIKKALGK